MILLPLFIYAQDEPTNTAQNPATGVSMGGSVGSVTVDNVNYSEIRILPEFCFGKVGVGLDIDLLIDQYGNIREEDWNEPKDIVNKIYYVRFAEKTDPFFFRIGGFPNYTLSHGLIMNQYSNMLKYPGIRQIGLMVGGNTKFSGLGVEAFSSNVTRNEILAGRIHINPMQTSNIPFLKKLIVGVEGAVDRNQYGTLNEVVFDTDMDGIPDNKDIDADNDGTLDASPYVFNKYPVLIPYADSLGMDTTYPNYEELIKSKKESVSEYGVDYELPLIEKKAFYLSHYAEAAKIKDFKMGFIFPGFYSKFLIFQMNAEMRHFQDQFVPGYFNQLYDQQRASIFYQKVSADSEIYAVNTKKETIASTKASTGWYTSITTSLWNLVYVTVAYQDMYNKDKNAAKSLTGYATVNPKILPRIKEASVIYSQLNVPKIKAIRAPNAFFEGRVSYGIAPNTYLIGRYQEIYTDINNDGKINTKTEIQHIYGTSVEFRF